MRSGKVMLLVVTVLAGAGAGYFAGSPRSDGRRTAEREVRSERRAREDVAHPAKPRLGLLMARVSRFGVVPEDAVEFLERSSVAEIFAAMEAMSEVKGGKIGWQEKQRIFGALRAAAGEIYRREGLPAVERAFGNGPADVAAAMIYELSRNDPSRGKDYWLRYNKKFGGQGEWGFSGAVLDGAGMRGARDLLAAEKLAGNGAMPRTLSDDFDFRAYLAESQNSSSTSVYGIWAASDPDAAAKALVEGIGTQAGWGDDRFAQALKGRAMRIGEEKAVEWICDALSRIPEKERKAALLRMANDDVPPSRVRALLDHLPVQQDKIALAVMAVGVSRMEKRNREVIVSSLPEELRVQVASEWMKRNRRILQSGTAGEELMAELQIPEARRAELRKSHTGDAGL